MRPLAFVPLMLLVAVPLLGATPSRADPAPPRVIRVTGQGEVKVPPDRATLSFSVVTRAPEAERAAAENARRMQSVLAALQRAGVQKQALQTGRYSVHPDYTSTPEGPPEQRGFVATNTLEVDVRELSRLGALIDAALKAGANEVQRVEFSLSEPEVAQARALARAVESGRAHAGAIALALGVQLGPVLEASTVAEQPPVQPLRFSRAAEAGGPSTPILPQEQTVTASVTLVFEIQPGARP